MTKIILTLILLISAGCSEAGISSSDNAAFVDENPEERGVVIKAIKGYAGINPIIDGIVTVTDWDSNEVLASATTDTNGIFNIFLPYNFDRKLTIVSVKDGTYTEPIGSYVTSITDVGLRAILDYEDIKYPIYITPFTDMLFYLYLNFIESSLAVNDPLKYARAIMKDYFEVDFLEVSPSANPGYYSTNDLQPRKHQLLIDGLSQMADDLKLESSYVLGRAFSKSLEANANFSGYTKYGDRIKVNEYSINYKTIRGDFVDALEVLVEKNKMKTKAMEDYLDRLRHKPSILFGTTNYAN